MRILAARDRVIHGGRGGFGTSFVGIQECIILRKCALKEDQEASMSEERRVFHGVERRSSLILEMSAFL